MSADLWEGLRRLSALAAVLAAVAAQSFVTRDVAADRERSPTTYGVQLLERALAEPVPLTQFDPPPKLTPPVSEPKRFAATLLQAPLALAPVRSPAARGATRWPRSLRERSVANTTRDWPENRDAAGALIRLTENDLLIPY
jgi:hypothetical protein